MIDAIHRGRRGDVPDEIGEQPPAMRPSPSPTTSKAPELEHPLHYPAELFSGSVFSKTPGVFGRPGAPAHGLSTEHAVREHGQVVGPAANGAVSVLDGKHVSGMPYTNSPNELGVQSTPLPAAELVALFRSQWPELSEDGARVLVAQSFGETANGRACFGYNFGNIKAFDTKSGHQYLSGTWEIARNPAEEKWWISQGGVPASAEFKASKGFPDANVFVINPPAPTARFRAFSSATDGAAFFVSFHKKLATENPEYLTALNRGDTKTVAHHLALHHYATADEASYAASMASHKKAVDGQLGPSS